MDPARAWCHLSWDDADGSGYEGKPRGCSNLTPSWTSHALHRAAITMAGWLADWDGDPPRPRSSSPGFASSGQSMSSVPGLLCRDGKFSSRHNRQGDR